MIHAYHSCFTGSRSLHKKGVRSKFPPGTVYNPKSPSYTVKYQQALTSSSRDSNSFDYCSMATQGPTTDMAPDTSFAQNGSVPLQSSGTGTHVEAEVNLWLSPHISQSALLSDISIGKKVVHCGPPKLMNGLNWILPLVRSRGLLVSSTH